MSYENLFLYEGRMPSNGRYRIAKMVRVLLACTCVENEEFVQYWDRLRRLKTKDVKIIHYSSDDLRLYIIAVSKIEGTTRTFKRINVGKI